MRAWCEAEDVHAQGRCLVKVLALAYGGVVERLRLLRREQFPYLLAYAELGLAGEQVVAGYLLAVGAYDLRELLRAGYAELVGYGHYHLVGRHYDVHEQCAGAGG